MPRRPMQEDPDPTKDRSLGLASVDAICADRHAPRLIPAAFRLVAPGPRDVSAAIAIITRNPARAIGLDERGEIAFGQLADLALVRVGQFGLPQGKATFIEGRQVLAYAQQTDAQQAISLVASASANSLRPFHC